MAQTVFFGAPAGDAAAVCVFLHGRGQSPREMIDTVLTRLAVPGIRFLLPKAPRDAWYDARAVDPLTEATSAQLTEALSVVEAAVEDMRAGAAGVPLVVAGFSQGACLATEYLMRGGRADAAAILTGSRVGAGSEDLPRRDLAGLPVYASCGDDDAWIPLWAFQKAVSEMAAAGARLRSDILPGRPHHVSAEECAELSRFLAWIAAAGPDGMTGTRPG